MSPAHIPWFAIKRLEPNVVLVAEPMHVNSFWVGDRNESVLIDTGLGVGDIREATARFWDAEPAVINTHHHFDHVGGNHLFARRAIHEDGARPIEDGASLDRLKEYGEFAAEMYKAFEVYAGLDNEYFGLVDDCSRMRPPPDRFEPPLAVPPTRHLGDGDVIEVGRHRLTVIHTPGHSPDSICLFDEYSGALFCGDTVNTGPMLAELPGSDISAYQQSTRRLADEFTSQAKLLYMCHGPRYSAPPEYLREVADAFEAVVDKDAPAEQIPDPFVGSALQAKFGDFSIIYPDAEGRRG